MELRHLRYFIAVADDRGFVAAARRIRIAQPALSKQIRDLEAELGVELFQRLARGVRLTSAGEAFLLEAREIVARADRAVHTAQSGKQNHVHIRLSHGDLGLYSSTIADLVSGFCNAHPAAELTAKDERGADQRAQLHDGHADVVASFIASWPLPGYAVHLLFDCTVTGVLLSSRHPLAAAATVRLAELQDLTYLDFAQWRWPEMDSGVQRALRERGLVMSPRMVKLANVTPEIQIATGECWTLATEAVGDYVTAMTQSIVYRPIADEPIPVWLALVALPEGSGPLELLADVARNLGLHAAPPQTQTDAGAAVMPSPA
jgi:DNA-binding transcriptional LysR family regulator